MCIYFYDNVLSYFSFCHRHCICTFPPFPNHHNAPFIPLSLEALISFYDHPCMPILVPSICASPTSVLPYPVLLAYIQDGSTAPPYGHIAYAVSVTRRGQLRTADTEGSGCCFNSFQLSLLCMSSGMRALKIVYNLWIIFLAYGRL